MGMIRYTPQGGHSRRAAKSAARQESPSSPRPMSSSSVEVPEKLSTQRNVEPVLALGATRYISIRGLGTFCCPPVPFKIGQHGMELYVAMMNASREIIMTGKTSAQSEYYKNMLLLAKVLHKHIRPVGFLRRKLWAIGLTRNRFLSCSEQEIKEIADFFLHGRMKSSVQFMSDLGEASA